MKTFVSLICAMLLTCASLLNAQNPTVEIKISGTLINPVSALQDYRVEVRQTGKNDRLLEEVKPDEDGTFFIKVFSDRPVRISVLDPKKNSIFRRNFLGTPDNHKLELKEIDLTKQQAAKSKP